MPGPPGKLMTREKIIFREWHQQSPTYERVTELFLESEFRQKGNKQTKKKSKILQFPQQQRIQELKLFKYSTENDKRKIGQNCHR